MAMACTEDCGPSTMPRRGYGPLVMSALLHLGGAALWLSLQTPPRLDDEPLRSMVVELTLEAPPPLASAEVAPPDARPTVAPVAANRPAPRKAAIPPPMPNASPATEAPPILAREEAAPAPAPRPVSAVDYGTYLGRLHDRIALRRVYPPQSIRRHEEGDVRLRVLVATDGRLLQIHTLAEASALLTQAARDAVESSAPFDPPPMASPSDQQMAFDVTVAFRIR